METVVEINGNGSEIVDEKENGRESSIAPVAVGMPNFDVEVLTIPRSAHLGPGSVHVHHGVVLSIFKIPTILYRHKEVAYIPNGFSFGPWHYHKPHLQATREIKIRCLRDVLGRCPNPRDKLAELKEGVRKMVLDGWIHRCYAEKVELSSDEQLVETLLLDGCFIIEVLWRHYLRQSEILFHGDDLLQSGLLLQYIYHDLILLENQIPWFVLTYLFGEVPRPKVESIEEIHMLIDGPLHVLVTQFFKNIFSYDGLIVEGRILKGQVIVHILDLLRTCMLFSHVKGHHSSVGGPMWKEVLDFLCLWHGEENLPAEMEIRLPSASRLKEAGIQFKRVKSKPMLDISFHNGVLEIPSLSIHETTESLFRNLIAYEQCQCRTCYPPIVASYAKLMDDLIDTVEDIEILSKSGVICNSLNPDDATQFFNLLCRDVYIDRSEYADIYREVNSYCKRLWPRWRAFYIHNYFAKPWAIVSQIFAVAILVLTILQVLHK